MNLVILVEEDLVFFLKVLERSFFELVNVMSIFLI